MKKFRKDIGGFSDDQQLLCSNFKDLSRAKPLLGALLSLLFKQKNQTVKKFFLILSTTLCFVASSCEQKKILSRAPLKAITSTNSSTSTSTSTDTASNTNSNTATQTETDVQVEPDIKNISVQLTGDSIELGRFSDGVFKIKESAISLQATGIDNAEEIYTTSSSSDCSQGGEWSPFSKDIPLKITFPDAEGDYNIAMKFRNQVGETICQNYLVHLDKTAPSRPLSSKLTLKAAGVLVPSVAGLFYSKQKKIEVSYLGDLFEIFTSLDASCSSGEWALSPTNTLELPGEQQQNSALYLKGRDEAKNETDCVLAAELIYDNASPQIQSFSIVSSTALYTTSNSVNLNITATSQESAPNSAAQTIKMYITEVADCASGGTYETYASSKLWTFSLANAGLRTVYIKVKDNADNESSCVSDTITYDAAPPSAPGSFSDGSQTISASTSPTMTWVASEDDVGILRYEVAVGSTAGAVDILPFTSVGNVTSTSIANLSLQWGRTYYASLRAVDLAARTSSVSQGDGFVYGYVQAARIKEANRHQNDAFGSSLAFHGDTLAASAPYEDSSATGVSNGSTTPSNNSSVPDAGAVYIMKRSSSSWIQEAYIKPPFVSQNDHFGQVLALVSDTLVIGVPDEDSATTGITQGAPSSDDNASLNSGAVYIYKRSNNSWTLDAYIKANNSGAGDAFGSAVAISEDQSTLIVGARNEDSNNNTVTSGSTIADNNLGTDVGAVYIFKRAAGVWAQEAYLKPNNARDGALFGWSVTISQNTVIVGARDESSNQNTITTGATSGSSDHSLAGAGAVYVFERSGIAWAQSTYMKANNVEAGDHFGHSLSFSGNTLVVGAPLEASNQRTITNGSVASTGSADNSFSGAGAAYVFRRTNNVWALEAYIKSSNIDAADLFGTSLALSSTEDLVVVGAPQEGSSQVFITNGSSASSDNSISDHRGAAYVFRRSGTVWSQEAYLKHSPAASASEFSGALAVTGTKIAVGAVKDSTTSSGASDTVDSGAVFIFNLFQ
ncbi:MAG: FG-GAP repeat protein [Oligoflexales bacterium]|nr:FG-GAP repeat protein [Oligoflexales bacterium]